MKKCFLFAVLFFCTQCFASTPIRVVKVSASEEPDKTIWDEDDRSGCDIKVCYENGQFSIIVNKETEDVEFAITSVFTKQVVYYNSIPYLSIGENRIYITDIPDGKYCLELLLGSDYYYGYFNVD